MNEYMAVTHVRQREDAGDYEEVIDALEFFLPDAGPVVATNSNLEIIITVEGHDPLHAAGSRQREGLRGALKQCGYGPDDVVRFAILPYDEDLVKKARNAEQAAA